MAFFVYEIVVTLFLILFLKYLFFPSKSSLDHIPQPLSLPIIGSMYKLRKKFHLRFMELSNSYGDIYCLKLGSLKCIVLNGHDTITEALCNQTIEFAGRPQMHLFKLFAESGGFTFFDYTPEWKLYRKLLVQSINKIISPHYYTQNYATSIEKVSDDLVNIFLEHRGEPFDPKDALRNSMFLFISSFLFGHKFTKVDKDILKFFEDEDETAVLVASLALADVFPFIKPFIPSTKKVKNMMIKQVNCINKMFQSRLSELEENKVDCALDAFLDYSEEEELRKESGEKITHEEILNLLFTIYGAGIETIQTLTIYSILFAICYPDLQQSIQQEIDSILPDGQQPTIDDVDRMIKLRIFLLETERYSSFIPFGLFRSVTKDVILKSYYLPKGTIIIPNIYSAHFDSRIWNEPQKFDPTRFLDANKETIDSNIANRLLLFGAGRRRCPGQYLARKNLMLIMAKLLQKFNITLAPEEKLDFTNAFIDLFIHPPKVKIIVTNRK